MKYFLLLLLVGCAPYPHVKYSDMDEVIEAAPTIEEKKYYEKLRDRFEKDAERAERFYEGKFNCEPNNDTVWVCALRPRDLERHPFKDLDDMVRAYRRENIECGCVNTEEMMRGIFG